MAQQHVAASAWPVHEQETPSSIARRGCDCVQQHRQLVHSLVALVACDNPPPSAAATQEALSAIHSNLRELDALCRAAGVPFAAAESLQELEARRDALAAQAAANNVRAPLPHARARA